MKTVLTITAAALLTGLAWVGPPGANSTALAEGQYSRHGYYPDTRHRGIASPRALARWYADQAHRQTLRAARMGCGFSGPRWRIDWRGHYRWAFNNRPGKLQREVDRRAHGLAQCRRQIGHHPRRYGRPHRR